MIKRIHFIIFFRLVMIAVIIAGLSPRVPRAQAQTNTIITLNVISTEGVPITEFKYLISVDNTGDPFNQAGCDPADPNYPDNCDLPSIRTVPGWAPIYTQGDHTTGPIELPFGKYLISVKADGYKMDGEHFSIPDGDGIVEVQMHPFPLPPATMVIQVFNDVEMTNGQFDVPSEVYDPLAGDSDTNYPMAGFRASINDIAGEITTDIFGNPLCTIYEKDPDTGEVLLDADGAPIIAVLGQGCYSDAQGIITIPNIGPLRYDVLIFPPTGEQWIQTTTLEGSQGWDTWLQEAGTGLDNEFLIAAEPAPWTLFGFVRPGAPDLGGTGTITGVVMAASTFVPAKDGLPYIGDTFGGFSGTKLHRPIAQPWLSLNSLEAGDTAVWVGQGNADGSFTIPNVPAGNYFLTYWDEKQHYILDFVQVTVNDAQISDVGIRMLTGWFTEMSGTVFHDLNENGKRDTGEPGIPNYLVVFKDRDNTEIDRMSIAALTDATGFYELEKGYPMGSWMVLEAYSDLHRTTGVTYQTLNMQEEVTLGPGIVDLGILPVLGQPIRVDWGVVPYSLDENGGIAGTVFYDTMRAEDEARYAGAEPFQPGIPGLTLNLYQAQMDAYGQPILAADGSYAKGQLLATTVTETFERPKGCQALDVNGNPVDFPPLPDASLGKDCLEGPMMGTQAGDGQNNLDGNWGFGDGCFGPGGLNPATGACADDTEPTPLTPGHYLVEVEVPNDPISNEPLLQVTREEDLNMFDGDEFVPAVPPPACAGPLHIVDIAGIDAEGDLPTWINPDTGLEEPNPAFDGDGPDAVENPGYVEAGGSRYEGVAMPLCNVKHVYLQNGKAVAPIFNFFTEVPIPGKWKGYIIDNLNVSVDPNTLFFGEMAGVPNVPIGLYDYSGRLVHTVHSDFNGVYEVLLPSTGTFNAPSPSGMFANVYYLYGNDPGPIGMPNVHYNPQYRSIGTSFEIYPGNIMPSDLAPTQNGAAVWAPGAQFNSLALCKLNDEDPGTPNTPELFVVSQPYGPTGTSFTITGVWFGDTPGSATLDGISLDVTAWSDTLIDVTVPAGIPPGPHQLLVENAGGLVTVNGLTFHITGGAYNPTVYEVGVGKTYDPTAVVYQPPDPLPPDPPPDPFAWPRGPIQHAIDDAWAAGGDALVVVYPGAPVAMVNPLGMYIENPVIYSPVKLQGVGPGGILPDGTGVPGAVIDGRAVGGDSPYNLWWRETFLPDVWNNRGGWDRATVEADGNPLVHEGAVITLLSNDGETGVMVDGFVIQGGDQQGFPNNIFQVGGGQIPGAQPNVVVQGGGIFANGYAQSLQISNNLIQANGGAYGGAIRLGTPHVAEPEASNHNENAVIVHNRILANGGTNLAGAVALFNGADGYEIAYNDVCGNSSIEYGGGISHYGLSPGGKIHDNRIYYNSSYDEGGGIMIAGELPADPTVLSPGAGSVDVYANLIHSNLANDDGGGLRFLMAGGYYPSNVPDEFGDPFVFNVFNNMVSNNVSTHEGGGISLNDAPYVNIFNNTVMKNLTTATALTSNGLPAPAGISSSRNSALMQATLPILAPKFSDPLLFNNLLWDNRAGTWTGDAVIGLGVPGDPTPIFNWDLGVADGSGLLSPRYSLLQTTYGTLLSGTNIVGQDPLVVSAYDTQVGFMPWRGNANFVGVHITTVTLPGLLSGDYHLQAGSPAIDRGVATVLNASPPHDDFDGDLRPQGCTIDVGADEAPAATQVQLFFAKEGNTPVPGFTASSDRDIYAWDGTSYCLAFDGQMAGLPPEAKIRSLAVVGDLFYLSMTPPLTIPGVVDTVRTQDIVVFDAANGSWSFFFDGSDVGIQDAVIDAFEILPNNSVLISTEGNVRVPGLTGNQGGEDLLRCSGGAFGPTTSCTWSQYFDGSDIGLRTDLDAAHVAASGDIYFSVLNATSIGNGPSAVTVNPEDVVVCQSPVTGANTSCNAISIYFDGSAQGIVNNLSGLDVP